MRNNSSIPLLYRYRTNPTDQSTRAEQLQHTPSIPLLPPPFPRESDCNSRVAACPHDVRVEVVEHLRPRSRVVHVLDGTGQIIPVVHAIQGSSTATTKKKNLEEKNTQTHTQTNIHTQKSRQKTFPFFVPFLLELKLNYKTQKIKNETQHNTTKSNQTAKSRKARKKTRARPDGIRQLIKLFESGGQFSFLFFQHVGAIESKKRN